ncbi:peptides ABC transporter substrate-binding protein [Bifidobacterium saguini DSM 23967]|uniref:Peptides ABC transporter substrate-binding protein n=2 Tax=Bifidobacterium saguini TaxID=762210 RepID=A0A087DEQ6_9BIFI|nr:ABC transporter substrate-binding protein [Bifidobacterium saguini]KFI94006.1 peptides ABC transporter substrate-binding protein [Bifidobacterium saguini DSM 23967]QTB90320.1 ABC transporter substrate-binding protein [Bifidobacterium saguini]
MSQDNGVHAQGGATGANGATTDASLASRAKNPKKNGPKWWLISLIAVIVAVAVVIGVTLAYSKKDDSTNASAGNMYADTVTIGLKLAPTNLDIRNTAGSALDQVLIGNVYEGIVARDSKNQVAPGLASSWEESKDGLTYTFHLNKNMAFSNGDKLDAEDVAWSINELIDKQYHDADALTALSKVEAKDADTVVMTLKTPNSNLLWTLTGRAGLVFDKDAKYDLKTQAVGSGPYTVAKFVENDSITLKANEKYWGKNKAKTPTIVIKYLADDNAAVNALKSGDVQVLAPITETLAGPFKSDSAKYTVKAGNGTDKYVLGFNNASGSKLADKRIRQAIRYAINHKEIIASRGGADKALGGPIPSLDPGYEDLTKLYPYDQAKAKSLMEEAGYSESNPLELSLTYANIYGTEIGDQLRSQLKPIGIDLKVNVVEFSTWLQDVYTNHDFDISLVDHNESHDFYSWADPTYYFGYDNAEVQKLYNEGVAATTDKERDAKFAEAAKLISEDAPADWLFNYRITTVTAKGVKGFPFDLNQTVLPLYNVTYSLAEFNQQ